MVLLKIMTVIERLKTVRHTLGISQKVFAKSIFISTSHLACMETGRRRIKDSLIDSISKVYNVNKEWLLTGKGEIFDAQPPDVKAEELITIFKRLNKHFREYLLDHVRHLEKIQESEIKEKK
jgi:transcriptional regulator with XRE-family HTH domain